MYACSVIRNVQCFGRVWGFSYEYIQYINGTGKNSTPMRCNGLLVHRSPVVDPTNTQNRAYEPHEQRTHTWAFQIRYKSFDEFSLFFSLSVFGWINLNIGQTRVRFYYYVVRLWFVAQIPMVVFSICMLVWKSKKKNRKCKITKIM